MNVDGGINLKVALRRILWRIWSLMVAVSDRDTMCGGSWSGWMDEPGCEEMRKRGVTKSDKKEVKGEKITALKGNRV
jgi:hypothetical protein